MLKKVFELLNKNILLTFAVFVAAVLRLYHLGEMPPSLNWDEVSHGYNAYSILKTGKDEWGLFFPNIFRAYGDYKLPVYIYTTALSLLSLGLNALAVRLPSAMAGIGIVFASYLLVKELFKDKKVALVTSLLVAVEPWSLFLSRGAFEANLALFFIIAGTYFFLKSLSLNTKYLVLSVIFFGLSVWTYNSARIFVPLLMIALFLIYKKDLFRVLKTNSKLKSFLLLLTTFMFVPMFWQLLNPAGQARYEKVSIIDEGAIAQIIESRNNSSFSPVLTRIIYNRPTYFLQRFLTNWTIHFKCSFLFIGGGSHYQFSVPGHGLLYWLNLPFFLLGLILLLKKIIKQDKTSFFVISWLLLAPIPSSLTREAPHVLRSIVMLPIPMVVASYGFVALFVRFGKIFKYFVLATYMILVSAFLANYLSKYYRDYKVNYSWSWQYGYKEVVEYSKRNYDKYDKIIMTKKYGEPHEFFLFYWPWNPAKYRNDPNLIRYPQSNWFWVDRFDKFYFVNDWDIPKEEWEKFKLESGSEFDCEEERCLLITSPNNVPKGWSELETIKFLDGKAAFEIYEN